VTRTMACGMDAERCAIGAAARGTRSGTPIDRVIASRPLLDEASTAVGHDRQPLLHGEPLCPPDNKLEEASRVLRAAEIVPMFRSGAVTPAGMI
jgi:hypothetical protein